MTKLAAARRALAASLALPCGASGSLAIAQTAVPARVAMQGYAPADAGEAGDAIDTVNKAVRVVH